MAKEVLVVRRGGVVRTGWTWGCVVRGDKRNHDQFDNGVRDQVHQPTKASYGDAKTHLKGMTLRLIEPFS